MAPPPELETELAPPPRPISPTGMDTLGSYGSAVFEKLGSWEMLSAVVTSMYNKLFFDARTWHFFSDVDQRKVMSHMTGFLSCALGGKMALSPKQVWLIHRDMLWSPDRAQQQQGPPPAAPQSSRCPVAGHSQAASMMSAPWPGACPMMTTDRPSVDSDSSVAHKGCPMSDPRHQLDRESGLPMLRPHHVFIMTEMLAESLVELNAREELIRETTKLLHSMCWIFERGDVFHDPKKKEEQWQCSQRCLKQMSSMSSTSSQALEGVDAFTNVDPWQLVAATVEDC